LVQTFLEEFKRWGKVGEKGPPGSELGFARAGHDDGEVVGWEGGEEGEDCGEEARGGAGRVDGLVEDVVEEDFEGVGEVGERLVVGGEVGGGGRVGGG